VEAQTGGSGGVPFVSVVIPAHNEEDYLPSCLERIRNQDYAGRYEIIVVDNASTDDTAAIALESGARVVYESRRSPACARQKGVDAAAGEIIAFIDADTQAPVNWLSTIVSRFLRDVEMIVVSGPYAYRDAGDVVRIASYIANFVNIIIDQLFRSAFRKGSAVWGCNFAVRRSALLQVGGFDTSIKFYGEEYELSLRLRRAGKGGIIPQLFVLTSARRLKRIGVVNQYWNWTVDYFSVLFWYRPITEGLEDWPTKAWQAVVARLSSQRVRTLVRYVVVLSGLIWLHIGPVVRAVGTVVYVFDIGILGAIAAYHGVNPRSRFYGEVWANGKRESPQIALTFDDGPNEPYTSHVLSILGQHHIRATFFVIGSNAQRHPDICRRIVDSGHVIGNHSYHHRKSLCLKSDRAIVRDIEMTHRTIRECAGVDPVLFRPPYGFRSPWLMRTAHRLGYTVVTWDNMTTDWKADTCHDEITERIIRRARPGGVIVLHDGRNARPGYDRSQMLQALPLLIKALKEKGFEFATVPELLGLEANPVPSMVPAQQ
jgi:peptidoglycan-N-acetylglucosamine deacetylase